MQTCKASMKFSAPAVVTAGNPVTVTLFSLIRNLAWFDLNVHADTKVGSICGGSTGGGVCTNYPGIVPYVGDTTTSLSVSTGAGQAMSGITANGDGTFKIDTFGSNPMTDSIGYLRVPAFTRLSAVNATDTISFLKSSDGTVASATTVSALYKRIQ